MKITTKLVPVPVPVAVALSAMVVLAGCAGNPSGGTTATKTATPTPTPTGYQPITKPGTVNAPKDQTAAWRGASATVKDFIAVQYEIQHDSGKNPERIDRFALGTARDNVHSIAQQLAEQKISVTGAPKWEADAAASSYGELIDTDGTRVENGTVYVVGCFDTSGQVSKKADGSVVPKSATVRFPVQFKTQYIPVDKSWKVAEGGTMKDGGPQC